MFVARIPISEANNLAIAASLPKGNFLWPAIWMLPATKKIWPIGGEIDLMESMGNSPEMGYALNYKTISSALHYGYNESLFPIIFSPFAGIGSEGYQSIKFGRRFIGIELKETYFNTACKNLKAAEMFNGSLFDNNNRD